jgi:hypothetical protein
MEVCVSRPRISSQLAEILIEQMKPVKGHRSRLVPGITHV